MSRVCWLQALDETLRIGVRPQTLAKRSRSEKRVMVVWETDPNRVKQSSPANDRSIVVVVLVQGGPGSLSERPPSYALNRAARWIHQNREPRHDLVSQKCHPWRRVHSSVESVSG